MYRSSITLLFLALFSFFTVPAMAQYSRENAASKKIDEAINEHYLATDFDKAENVLTGTIKACEDKCSPQLLGKAWMYVGIVRGSGKNDQKGAADAFAKALALDAAVKLDTQLATPETQKTFANAGGGGGGDEAPEKPSKTKPAAAAPAAPGAGMNCTPDVREMQTRRPVPVQCSTDEEAASMDLRYKSFGGETWKTVKMKKVGDTFRGEVPCDASSNSGTLKLYVTAKDASGEKVDNWGSKSEPIAIEASETSTAEPPAYDGEEAPARCQAKGECPPDFPGCSDSKGPKRGGKDWGAACDNSTECKEGLLCESGTCETAPSCETAADCSTGVCTDGKCSVADDGSGASGPYKKNWIGLHFAQDWAFVGGTDVCQFQNRAQFACYQSGSTTDSFTNDAYPGSNVATGAVFATHRILLSYDRAFTSNITVGARVGFAFGGGPPAGKDSTTAGTAFLPIHAEARLTYWFGKGALGKKGLRPYVHAGGGVAQVDAKVPVTVTDCQSSTQGTGPCPNGDPSVNPDGLPSVPLDAWRKMGQGFVTAGGGIVYAFTPKFGAQLNANFMFMLGSSGPVIEPSLGVVYGL
ncbi:MAG TPA: hypothetical protein VGI10_08270 [Polyangiaceae bacterium]